AAVMAVVTRGQLVDRAPGYGGIERTRRDELASALHLAERAGQAVRRALDLLAACREGLGQGGEDRRESGMPAAVVGREVGPAPERLLVRGEEYGHRPPARPRQELHGPHVDLIHVGPLFAIHLDRDEFFVQKLRDRLALERLALHHVTPVAGAVADREKDGFVLAPRLLEGFGSPGVPIHGVPLVLEKVGALLFRETVWRAIADVRRGGHRRFLRRTITR